MNQKTKTKISRSLKRHYRRKQKNKEIKILVWIMLLIALVGFYNKHNIKVLEAAKAPEARNAFLPINPDKTEMTIPEQIRAIAYKEGFKWPDYLVRLAECESMFNPKATNLNNGHSLDAGLFQINQYYHPDVGLDCSLDVECATKWTMEQINAGRQSMWVCDKYIN